jgi:RHS repeat-associated protein
MQETMRSVRWLFTLVVLGNLGSVGVGFGQATTENYVKSYKANSRLTGSLSGIDDKAKVSEGVIYVDGLGRPLQSVLRQNTPTGFDQVTFQQYDEYGRVTTAYLPYATTSNTGNSKTNLISDQSAFYQSLFGSTDGVNAFTVSRMENSELNRVVKTGAPGAVWQPTPDAYSLNDNSIKKRYKYNLASQILLLSYDTATGLIGATTSYYVANSLSASVTIDENNNETIEYTDKEGRTVCKKVQYDTQSGVKKYAETYFLYNGIGDLVCVLPPEGTRRFSTEYNFSGASNATREAFLRTWAFRYRYDRRRRMIIKVIPGAQAVFMIYDNRDRLVLTQDGNRRSLNQWIFTKYDMFNRPIATGIKDTTVALNRTQMQAVVNNFYSTKPSARYYEEYIGSVSGNIHGYSNKSYPVRTTGATADPQNYLTLTYYDNYDFKSIWGGTGYDYVNDNLSDNVDTGSFQQPVSAFTGVKGQVTGKLTRALVTNANVYIRAIIHYDNHLRPIQTITDNFRSGAISGTNRVTMLYDFAGRLIKTRTVHAIGTSSQRAVAMRRLYDHGGRMIAVYHQTDANPEVLTTANAYNELGQLVSTNLHRTDMSAATVTADPLVGQQGVSYSSGVIEADTYSNQTALIAKEGVILKPGFNVPTGSNFTARTGYSQADANSLNNSISAAFKQKIDYVYNIRGWLTNINDPMVPDDDYFSMQLRYDNPTANGGTAQYNGNISEIVWKNKGGERQSYGYEYDKLNRILSARYFDLETTSNNGRYDETIGGAGRPSYDLNGNILNLLRKGQISEGSFGDVDDLSYNYGNNGNQLIYVSDAIATQPGENGFKEITEGTADYTYDANGNMISDANKGIASIVYNYLNLPARVTKTNGEYIKYTYDATGMKLSQDVFNSANFLQKTSDYAGDFFYENDTLQFVNHDNGRIIMTGSTPEYQYYLKDHLGNVRTTFTTVDQSTIALATLETPAQTAEKSQFLRYDNARRVSSMLFDHTGDGVGPATVVSNNFSSTYAPLSSQGAMTLTLVSGRLKVGNAMNSESALFNLTTVVGRQYKVTVDIDVNSSGNVYLIAHDHTVATHIATLNVNANGTYSYQFTAQSTSTPIMFMSLPAGPRDFYIDNLVIEDISPGGNYAVRLNGSANEKYGLARSLSVMPGDTIKMEVFAKYVDPNSTNWTAALNTLMSQVASGSMPATRIDGAGYSSSTSSFAYPGLLSTTGSSGGPKAYLNWLIFDRNFGFITGGYRRLSSAPMESGQNVLHERLWENVVVTEPGYVYVYLSNEETNPVEVYFDDFKVEHVKSPVIESQSYYPFGLTFDHYQRENSLSNQIKFQGQEHQDELDLGWDSFKWRNHMPDIGRFFGIDKLAEKYYYNSPYAFSENKVVAHRELEGLESWSIHKEEISNEESTPTWKGGDHTGYDVTFTLTQHTTEMKYDENGVAVARQETTSVSTHTIHLNRAGAPTFLPKDTPKLDKQNPAFIKNLPVKGATAKVTTTTTPVSTKGELEGKSTTTTSLQNTGVVTLNRDDSRKIRDAARKSQPGIVERYFRFITSKQKEEKKMTSDAPQR